MSSLRNTPNTTFSSSGIQQTSLTKYEVGIVYYGLVLVASKTAFLPCENGIFWGSKMATDNPAVTVPCAVDFHYRFVQLWDLPLNHGPKVLLQLPIVLSEL